MPQTKISINFDKPNIDAISRRVDMNEACRSLGLCIPGERNLYSSIDQRSVESFSTILNSPAKTRKGGLKF